MQITQVTGRELLDSRGNPTVEADVLLEDGSFGRSRSVRRVYRLERSRGTEGRRQGPISWQGPQNAVKNIKGEIAKTVIGMDAADQASLDRSMVEIDETENKGRLGANAILAVSMAACRAAAASQMCPLYRYIGGLSANVLPVPLMNILNGGVHADNSLGPQELWLPMAHSASPTPFVLASRFFTR